MAAPFVYIAALRRSGSNLLCEGLSELPLAFMFREPGVARGQLRLKTDDRERFAALGVDLRALRRARPEGRLERIADFRDRVLPTLLEHVTQIGIKEINHRHWRDLLSVLPSASVLVTARDPRDVYLSLHEKRSDRGIAFKGELSPEGVSQEIRQTFAEQRAMIEMCRAHRVRYEDLCTDPACWRELLEFVESPLTGPGAVGELNRHNRRLLGEEVSDRHVGRWRSEPDRKLRAEAEATFERVPEYAKFWGYA